METKNALEFSNAPKNFLDFLYEEERLAAKFVKGKESVIDIGCGRGRAIPILSPLVKKYVGIDKDFGCVKDAKRKAEIYPNTKIILADFKKAQKRFKKGEFDAAILLWNTLCLFEKPAVELKKIGEIAKGNVFFSLPFRGALQQRLEYYNRLGAKYKVDNATETIYSKLWGKVPAYNKKEVLEIVKKAGLAKEKLILYNKFVWIITTRLCKTN